MPTVLDDKLVVAISSRALFDLDESNRLFENEGVEAYSRYQMQHEEETLARGVAFPLIRRLLALRYPETQEPAVEIVLVSKNDPNTGLRVFNSIEHHQLNITRAAFTNGRSPYQYLSAFRADLFLSANPEDVRLALLNGYASATIYTDLQFVDDESGEIRIAFDGDAVIFSDEAERVYQEHGLAEFQRHELEKSETPLPPGPFKPFLEALNKVQRSYQDSAEMPIRTALVTARSAPSHKRAIKTLRSWGVRIDEAFFLGGLDKAPILDKFKPHIFFDDQQTYCQSASRVAPTGHVPSGVKNE
jgi:5'-nucleotidase